ncbi:hypothetical protein DCAR_0832918 [Daucus carota subsp. sativus]|uniref:Uncharacterized protein n=1 Tax=Daucus carota subsp. sativus TaxID=79200 RepID=A0A175YQI1_DAUCS|nr:PREDICTED: uncharacterized protein LOC108198556 [Daucus carota subsp. sativus]WOH13408.1 hypothetical protein DCAR_0832918 [Daucus carota subsp. sativus]
MRERGKSVEESSGNNYPDFYAYSFPCKKHPSSTSVGICPYCLKERLIKLVCSDCGEQRLSSCSCSDVSSYRNSCSTMEIGSVGRISFLIENEKTDQLKAEKSDDEVIMLKRSNSTCTEVKRSHKFWKFGKLFRKKREKQSGVCEKSDMCVSDYMGVSRSRSLCSFRGNHFLHDPDHESSDFAFSSAKISDFNESEPRRSGFSKGLMDVESAKISDFSEPRKSGFSRGLLEPEDFNLKKCVFPESEFSGMDDSRFIDLKLDLSSSSEPKTEAKTEYSVSKMSEFPISSSDNGRKFGNLKENKMAGHGGSCRITVNEKRINKGSKGQKVWRWIFSHHHHGWRSASKKDGNQILKI